MKIVESLSVISGAKIEAAKTLENIGDVPVYHNVYKVRHPLAAYNTSISSVSQRILRVIEILDEVQLSREFTSENSEKNWETPLVEATDHMLDSLMEHMEDCIGILRSFFSNSKDKKFKSIKREYESSVSSYRKHIGKIVNYMKHNQGRLRIVSVSWSTGSSLGYFVEGPVSSDGLGPVSEVHPDESSAFSFYRDIPFHLCNVCAVSRRLAYFLREIDSRLVPKETNDSHTKETDLIKALEAASKLPKLYFEDERKKGIPQIKVTKTSIKIDYPCMNKKLLDHIPSRARVGISFRGDGVTKSYKIPIC